jgi:prepilin-type N-terminal cleavage/methylation domain-containing protein/prepilin-type processing-associated H-X9-DG protein
MSYHQVRARRQDVWAGGCAFTNGGAVAVRGPRIPRGFTLIECICAIGVIAILALLTVQGVQSARESARRIRCASNFRQLGLALNSYHVDHNMFPSSVLIDSRGISWNCLSEHVFLLPYLEQQQLFASINMDFACREFPDAPSLQNGTARRTVVEAFICPSDGEPDLRNSYRFNRGRFRVFASGHSYDGPFSIGVLPRASVIKDGLSGTAFASERIGGSFLPGSTGLKRDVRYPDVANHLIDSDNQLIPFCLSYEPSAWMTTSGRYWFYAGFANAHYNHNGVPNDLRPSCYSGGMGNQAAGGLSPPRSFHGGFVNVLFGDGHLEPVRDSIEPNVWQAKGTYNAGD